MGRGRAAQRQGLSVAATSNRGRTASPGQLPKRNLERTVKRLVAAAEVEFAARGFDGARTEAMARRARVNKRMLFYCFGSKQRLYREIVRRKLAARSRTLQQTPDELTPALLYWQQVVCSDGRAWRMMQWEALSNGRLVAERDRAQLMREVIERLRQRQAHRAIAPEFEPESLFIAVMALTVFPGAFPQLTRLVTGLNPRGPEFRAKWTAFLGALGERLSAANRPGRHRESARGKAPGHTTANGPTRPPGSRVADGCSAK